MAFSIGEQVGDYQILEVLGAGGMGKVYRVRNVISDRMEAMKILLPDLSSDVELADRFSREVKVLASLSHPNIAGLHTALKIDNQLLMVMEYIEGQTVHKQVSTGPLPVNVAIKYADQILDALSYAHAHGIIHRDIKPANFMVVAKTGVVKLMDFGIARPLLDSRLTQTGRTVGSLPYMSPEQINGMPVDHRADIYAFGISLYEMITGVTPFTGTSDFSIMAGHLNQEPRPPIQVDPRLPQMLSDIILMAISKDPAQRFQTAEAFRGALKNVTGDATTAMPSPQPALPMPPPPAPSGGSSHRGLYFALGSLFMVGLLVAAAIQVPKYLHTQAQPAPQVETKKDVPKKDNSTPAQPASQPDPLSIATASNPDGSPKLSTIDPASLHPLDSKSPVVEIGSKTQPPVADTRPHPSINKPPNTAEYHAQNDKPAVAPPTQLHPQESQPAQPPKQQQTQAAAAPDNSEQVEEAREDYIKLSSREKAAANGLGRLEQSMNATGGGLRADMVQARERMAFYLNDAETALRSGNLAGAKTAMSKADREVSKIESFLGH